MSTTAHPTGLPLKAEQTFFNDPAIDRIMTMVMTLAAEFYVTRDRLACLEILLDRGEPVSREALDRFEPTPEEAARLDAARQALSAEFMRCSMGIEASLGAPEDGVDQFDRS